MSYHASPETDRGHVWVTRDAYDWDTEEPTVVGTEVDVMAFEAGEYHNGPRCAVCGYGFCHHCNDSPQIDCPGRPMEDAREDYSDSNLIGGGIFTPLSVLQAAMLPYMDEDSGDE